MNTEQLKIAIKAAIAAGIPSIISGPPGVGKSDLVRQVAKETGRNLYDVRAALKNPVDFLGMPQIVNGFTHFRPPADLPAPGGPSILFLDELPNAPIMVQSALLQLVLNQKLGAYTLPDDCAIIAAGNRAKDRAGAGRLIASLADRFLQLEIDVDHNAWVRWALHAGVATEIIAFIRWRPELLADIDPARNVNASPRAWEMLSKIMPHTPAAMLHPIGAGLVGDGPAAEFSGFMAVFKTLPDPAAVLLNPAGAPVPTDPSTLYALVTALSIMANEQTGPGIIQYAERLTAEGAAEYGVLLVRDAVVKDPAVCDSRDFQRWATDNNSIFTAA